MSREGGEGARVVRWEGGRFLVLFKGGGYRVSPRFYLFCLMLVNGNNEQVGFKIFLRSHRAGKTLLRSFASC